MKKTMSQATKQAATQDPVTKHAVVNAGLDDLPENPYVDHVVPLPPALFLLVQSVKKTVDKYQ